MSETTNLQLFKHDNPSTNTNQFDIERALNENWDKIDTAVGGLQSEITNNNKLSSDLVDDTNKTNKFVTITEKTTWSGKYDKPSEGIPKTDLASDVQASLSKADTSLQAHQDISGKEDKSNKVTTISSSSTNEQYPSAKCVYDSQINQDEEIEVLQQENAELKIENERLKEDLESIIPSVSGTGEEVTLEGTSNARFKKFDFSGNTKQEEITPRIPTEYQEVEYIQSSGTQYLNTGVVFDNNTKIQGEFSFASSTSSESTILGCGKVNAASAYVGISKFSNSNNITAYCHLDKQISISYDTNKHEFEIAGTNAGNIIRLDNTSGTVKSVSDTKSIYLFGLNENNGTGVHLSSARIYSLKIYQSGTLVRDFIPCFRKSDNEIGLYDLANNSFYTRLGTGTFIKGGITRVITPDNPKEIKSVGDNGSANVAVENQDGTKSQTFIIPIQQPFRKIGDYADKFVKQNGVWKEKHYIKEFVLDGTENWNQSGLFSNSYYTTIPNALNISSTDITTDTEIYLYCNKFYATYRNNLSSYNYGIALSNDSSILVRNVDINTASDFKTFLTSNNTKIWYIVEEPIYIECTQEQIAVLEQIEKEAHSYEGTTYISSEDEISPIFEVEALKKVSDLEENSVVLYDNSSGSKTDIELSDNVNNYDFIEIFFRDANSTADSMRYKYDGTHNSFVLSTILNFGSSISIDSKGYIINNNALNKLSVRSGRYSTVTISNSVSTQSTDNIEITKVIGYKEVGS